MSFIREHDFDAVVGEGAEYAFFDPPRYFSSEHMKLTFRGSLETRELILDEVAKQLNLHPNRFCLLSAMLGELLLACSPPFPPPLISKMRKFSKLTIMALLALFLNPT